MTFIVKGSALVVSRVYLEIALEVVQLVEGI